MADYLDKRKAVAKKMIGEKKFKHDGKVFSLPIYKGRKGKESLNKAKGEHNEGEKMMLSKNEHNRA